MAQNDGATIAGEVLGDVRTMDHLPSAFSVDRYVEYGPFRVWYGLGQKQNDPVLLVVCQAIPAPCRALRGDTGIIVPFKFPRSVGSIRQTLKKPVVQLWLGENLQGDDRAFLQNGGERLLPESPDEHFSLVMNWIPYS